MAVIGFQDVGLSVSGKLSVPLVDTRGSERVDSLSPIFVVPFVPSPSSLRRAIRRAIARRTRAQ